MTSRSGRGIAKVVIVGKTRLGSDKWCIGALEAYTLKSRRLMSEEFGYGWPSDTEFQIGQIWSISRMNKRSRKPPHTEDVDVSGLTFFKDFGPSLPNFIVKNVPISRGGLNSLFSGKLQSTKAGSMRILKDNVPSFSTQFWIPPFELIYTADYYRIVNPEGGNSLDRKIPFKGGETPRIIQAGSLVRVSLSHWYSPTEHGEKACYLQVSGWWDPPSKGGSW